jgi:hypothetical protein
MTNSKISLLKDKEFNEFVCNREELDVANNNLEMPKYCVKYLDNQFELIINGIYHEKYNINTGLSVWSRATKEIGLNCSNSDRVDFFMQRLASLSPEDKLMLENKSLLIEKKLLEESPVIDSSNQEVKSTNSDASSSNSSSDPALSGDFSTLKWIWEIMASYPITTATISLTVVGGGLAIAYYYWWPENSDSSSKNSIAVEKDKPSS